MQQLRERGIYTLPFGEKEFVAHAVFRGGYVLYTPENWEAFGPYTYEFDKTGYIVSAGQSTAWHIDDLADTNHTARARSRSGGGSQSESDK
jgi:hypothetical protein